jgi:hypothetical protein
VRRVVDLAPFLAAAVLALVDLAVAAMVGSCCRGETQSPNDLPAAAFLSKSSNRLCAIVDIQ